MRRLFHSPASGPPRMRSSSKSPSNARASGARQRSPRRVTGRPRSVSGRETSVSQVTARRRTIPFSSRRSFSFQLFGPLTVSIPAASFYGCYEGKEGRIISKRTACSP